MRIVIKQFTAFLLLSLLIFASMALAQTKMYWVEFNSNFENKIRTANLDGTNIQDVLTVFSSTAGMDIDNVAEKVYWTDITANKIQRADLDGNNIEDVLTGLTGPVRITLDVNGGKMYWIRTGITSSTIRRADLDGSNVEDVLNLGSTFVVGFDLDISGGKMYWKTTQPGSIQRANLDGSNMELLLQIGNDQGMMTLDTLNGKIYWVVEPPESAIMRADLDGSNVDTLINNNPTPVIANPRDITLDLQQGKMYWTDLNDGKIQRANLDGSNIEDVIASGLSTPMDLELGIGATTAIDDDVVLLSGEYVLHQNYPNPFNPTTTINYYLPVASNVELTIFNVLGQKVKSVVNAHQPAGSHQVNWNAKDESGIWVPSGIYYYKLRAVDSSTGSGQSITQTKKMLLMQ